MSRQSPQNSNFFFFPTCASQLSFPFAIDKQASKEPSLVSVSISVSSSDRGLLRHEHRKMISSRAALLSLDKRLSLIHSASCTNRARRNRCCIRELFCSLLFDRSSALCFSASRFARLTHHLTSQYCFDLGSIYSSQSK